MTGRYRLLEHTSEVGIEGSGDTCEEAFQGVAEGVASLLGAWFPGRGTDRPVSVSAADREALLVAWVDELLYLHEAEDLVFGGFRVDHVGVREASGRAAVTPAGGRSLEGTGVKAATFHRLLVVHRDGRWTARVYVDV